MSWPKLWTPGSSGEIHFSTEISWSFDTQASWHGFAHLVFSFNNSYTHPKFHIAAGKWLEDYYFRLGKWVTCQGLWKTRGGLASFWMNWTKSTLFQPLSCTLSTESQSSTSCSCGSGTSSSIWSSSNLCRVSGWRIQTSSQWDVTSSFGWSYFWLRQWPPRSDEFCCTSLWCRPWMRDISIYLPIPKALRRYTLSLGKAQTMSCIWD